MEAQFMSRYFTAGLAAALLLSSCHDQDQSSNAVSSQAKMAKPRVAIAPAIDNSKHSVPWNLSDEITYSLFYRLDQKEKFFLDDPQKMKSISKRLHANNNPFGGDLKWIKRAFNQDDFVVFLEVLEHEETPNLVEKTSLAKDCSANLNMTMRVIVVDIRQTQPVVVLQEVIQDSHFIPRQFNQYNFHQVYWGNEEFAMSPLGMAHTQFLKEISTRIEDYITLAKGS
jgi:hypothetical protein